MIVLVKFRVRQIYCKPTFVSASSELIFTNLHLQLTHHLNSEINNMLAAHCSHVVKNKFVSSEM